MGGSYAPRMTKSTPAAAEAEAARLEDPFYEDAQPIELVCTVCKGTSFIDQEADCAFKSCADCGTQVLGHITEATGYQDVGTHATVYRRAFRNKTERVYTHEADTRPSAEVAFEAFQCVLQALLDALVARCGCDAEVVPEVCALWFRVVPLCAEAHVSPDGNEWPQLQRVPTMAASTCGAQISLGPALALALCHLGCLRRALPLRVDDLLAWGRADVLPLLTAHLELPARLQPAARWFPSAMQRAARAVLVVSQLTTSASWGSLSRLLAALRTLGGS